MSILIMILIICLIVLLGFILVSVGQLHKRITCMEKLYMNYHNSFERINTNLDKIYNHTISIKPLNDNYIHIMTYLEETIENKLSTINNKIDTVIINQSNIASNSELYRKQIIDEIKTVNSNTVVNIDKLDRIDTKVNVIKNTSHIIDTVIAKISSQIDKLYNQSQTKKKSNAKLKTAKKLNSNNSVTINEEQKTN